MGDNEDYTDIDPLMRTAKYSSRESYIQYSGGAALLPLTSQKMRTKDITVLSAANVVLVKKVNVVSFRPMRYAAAG